VPWHARRSPGPGLPAEVAGAARAARESAADLVHLHSAKAGLAGRLALRGRVPTVFQPHAWSYEAATGPLRAASVRWERYAARWAHRVLCVSEAERASGLAHGIAARWHVVRNGVDTARFTPAVRQEGVRAELARWVGLREPGGPDRASEADRASGPDRPGDADRPGEADRPGDAAAAGGVREPGGAPERGGARGPGGVPEPGGAPEPGTWDRPEVPGAGAFDAEAPGAGAPGAEALGAGAFDAEVLAVEAAGTVAPGVEAIGAGGPGAEALGAGVPLVVCVGRLCRQKGQDLLLEAWPQVTARLPEARLVLVGDGPDAQALWAAAPRGVLFAGAAADPVRWYQAADVVVQPSRWEGMALAPLEAMACGRPVVLTDVGGARECLPEVDAAHCVVPPGDAAALATALLRLLTDPVLRSAASLRALARVRERHDLRDTTAAVTALYAHLLDLPAREATPR
jgi:glycosyltransferase involved in cell wall biosynthesis